MANPSILDAVVGKAGAAGGAGSITINTLAVSSGATHIINAVAAKQASPATITPPTWHGASLTLCGASGYDGIAAIYALASPDVGTFNDIVAFSNSPRAVLFALTLQNSGAPRTAATATQSLNTGAATTVAGDLCVAIAMQNSAAPTAPAGWTDQGTFNVDATTYGRLATFTATGTSTTAAFGNANGDWCGSVLVPFPAAAGGSAAVTGTGGSGMTGADVRAGGKTLIVTLTGDTFLTFDNTIRQAIIDGIVAGSSPTWGWNAVRPSIPTSAVVRTSSTVCTITLPALPNYQSDTTLTLTVTTPSTALTGGVAIVATPTVAIARTVTDLDPVGDFPMTGTATRT